MQNFNFFSPNTLPIEYHEAYNWAIRRNYYHPHILDTLNNMRETHPTLYTELATMANEGRWKHGNSYMFHCGVRLLWETGLFA